jgi:hypothetical protein
VNVCGLLALAQWLFFALIYERFFEHALHSFCDLCSVCNISVVLLEGPVFGYYIHGRSVHGRSDVGLRQTHTNMVREEVTVAFTFAEVHVFSSARLNVNAKVRHLCHFV